MQQSSSHWSRKLGDGLYVVVTSIILCVAIVTVFPYLITEFALVNVNASPTVPWFLLPSAGVCFYAVVLGNYLCKRKKIATRISLASSFFMLILGVVGLLLLSLALTRWYGYHFIQIALPGDKFAASNGMRAFISLAKLGAAGPIEEAAVRGAVQLRVQKVIGIYPAEVLAGVVFIALHFDRLSLGGELPFVTATAIVCGRFTSITKRFEHAALLHGLANVGSAAIILALR
jgi:membrane protease YdiL (CAAX protease family)